MRILANNTKKSDFEFDSIYEFIQYVKDAERHEGGAKNSETKNSDFAGTDTIEQAYEIAISGGDFTRQLSENITLLEESKNVCAVPTGMHYDVTGEVLDVGVVLTGAPECFLNYEYNETAPPQTKFLTFYIDLGARGDINSAAMLGRAAAIATIIDILEAQNIRVRVILEHYGKQNASNKTNTARISMIAKQFNETLQINKLAGALHPSFYRRLIFKHFECCEIAPTFTTSGYGVGVSGSHDDKPETYHFPRINTNYAEYNSTWIKQQLRYIQYILK